MFIVSLSRLAVLLSVFSKLHNILLRYAGIHPSPIAFPRSSKLTEERTNTNDQILIDFEIKLNEYTLHLCVYSHKCYRGWYDNRLMDSGNEDSKIKSRLDCCGLHILAERHADHWRQPLELVWYRVTDVDIESPEDTELFFILYTFLFIRNANHV